MNKHLFKNIEYISVRKVFVALESKPAPHLASPIQGDDGSVPAPR